MRLLVVSQYFWPEDFRINELVAELSRRGHAITVLTGKPNYPNGAVYPAFLERPAAYSSYCGARVVRVPMLSRGQGGLRLALNYLSYALSATVIGIVTLRDEQYDAIFVFEPSPITVGLPAVAMRAVKGWPVVFWVLDQWPETLAAAGVVTSRVGLAAVGRLASFIYTRCDVILAQSRALVGPIRKYCGNDKRVMYFPNWAEAAYGESSASAAPEVPKWTGKFTVMFAGNVGESQHFPAILDAADQLKQNDDIRWVIIGDGRAAATVKAEVIRRRLQDKFILLGRYSADRMPSFYSHASALLVSLKPDPIFSMTVPGKIQSYLAFGLPVLGMLDGEGARVIEEAQAGLTCAAGDSRGLAAIVQRMSELTYQERSTMGVNGAAYARQEFDRGMLIDRLEGLLDEVSAFAAE